MQEQLAAVDDTTYFRELEAMYLLRLLLGSCGSTLESCAYEMQDASAILKAGVQGDPQQSGTHALVCNAGHAMLYCALASVAPDLCAPVCPAESDGQKFQVAGDGTTQHDAACWAFSSKYIKTTKAGLHMALGAILVSVILCLRTRVAWWTGQCKAHDNHNTNELTLLTMTCV